MTISTSTRTRVVVLLTSVGLVLALLFAISVSAAADPAAGAALGDEPAIHLVRSGDTLWDIALTHLKRGDVRDLVEQIKQVNGLPSSLIVPGQVLVIPAAG